jgi:hypothetical protein
MIVLMLVLMFNLDLELHLDNNLKDFKLRMAMPSLR